MSEREWFVVPYSRWQRLALWVLPVYTERVRRRHALAMIRAHASTEKNMDDLIRVIAKLSASHPDYAHIRPDRHLHLMK